MSKVCTKCKTSIPLSGFYNDRRRLDGLTSECKSCAIARSTAWKLDNKDEFQKYSKRYYKNNKKAFKIQGKKNYKKHKDKISAKYVSNKANGTNIIGWLILKYEGVPCLDCNRVFPWCAMEFDHRPEEIKRFDISTKNRLLAIPERITEIEKEIACCDLVCSCCHSIRTQERCNAAK